MIRRVTLGIAVLVLAGGMVFFSRSDLNRIFLPTATGITAKQVCSLHFISGFTPERARELYLDPLSAEAAPLIRSRVGPGNNEVRASLLGLYRRRAVYREGVGCSLVHDGRDFDADLALPPTQEPQPLPLDSAHRVARFNTRALDAALTEALGEPEAGGRNTLAVVILHQGRLVAEGYGAGITPATPLHGWSMTRSVAATLAGAMVHRGEIDITQPGAADAPGREDITLEHLLRMTVGLDHSVLPEDWPEVVRDPTPATAASGWPPTSSRLCSRSPWPSSRSGPWASGSGNSVPQR